MQLRTFPLAIKLSMLGLVAAFGVLIGLALLGPAPQSAEASFLTQIKKLLASDAEASDFFGHSVAIDSDTAVVGAIGEDAGGGFAGAAYVLQRSQGGTDNWGEVAKLTASDAQPDAFFGESVAISGDTVVVGAFGETPVGFASGAAYVFHRDQGGADNWGEVKKLTASDAQAGDQFGFSVAISGDTVVVGALKEDAGGANAGAAYVFQRGQGGADNWGEVKKITASDAQAGDHFGISVAISSDTAVVGAKFEETGGFHAGAAYVFHRDQGGADNWGEVKKLTASDVQAGDHFGHRVAVSGSTVVVGARDEDAGGDNAGAAYVFQRDQGGADNWGEVSKLSASDSQGGDAFGVSVAVSGSTAVIGAWGADAAAGNAGAAYVFQEPLPTPTATPCPTGGCPDTPTPTITPTVTPTPRPPAMSLRVDAAQAFPCAGGPVVGKVCVDLNQKFDVVVVADAIPSNGYILAQAWIDYDNQGLVHKPATDFIDPFCATGTRNPCAIWPDLAPSTFFTVDDVANYGMGAFGLVAKVPPNPPSFHTGDLYSFSLTCTATQSANQLTIIPFGGAPAGTAGALFVDAVTGTKHIPAVTGLTVNCAAKPPKLAKPGDTDGDGCPDAHESGPDEMQGGQRDFLYPYDYFDVLGPSGSLTLDGVIDLPNDILGVIQHFSPQGQPPYEVRFDRGTQIGANHWERDAPDGVIDLPNDILGVILQFGHNCV